METAVFLVASAVILAGAVGVIAARNPVHSALMLVMTLFGVAVLFVVQEAHFLAAVQVIVYAGAIVVLFLFVIMLLGVDQVEDLRVDPIAGQRPAGIVAALGVAILVTVLGVRAVQETTGAPSVTRPLDGPGSNIQKVAEGLFTDYVFAFEVTGAVLVIAVVGAVVMARRPRRDELEPADEEVEG